MAKKEEESEDENGEDSEDDEGEGEGDDLGEEGGDDDEGDFSSEESSVF